MKIVCLFCILAFTISTAQQKFDCNNVRRADLYEKYLILKHLGVDYKFPTGEEVIPIMLTKILDDASVRQVCIDSWSLNKQYGTNTQYNSYIETVKPISREVYDKNYDYLNMFVRIISEFERTTNYIRRR